MSGLQAALDLLCKNYWPVAIYPKGCDIPTKGGGKKIAKGKEPIGTAWGMRQRTESELRAVYERIPEAGVGLVFGCMSGLIDIEVDDPEKAAPVLARMFPDGILATMGWTANRGQHLLFVYDPRLARYMTTRERSKGVIKDHPSYPGIEFRIGTTDPARPIQVQSVCPPTTRDDGTPREWNGYPVLSIPETVFDDIERHMLNPEPRPAALTTVAAKEKEPVPATKADPHDERQAAWFKRAMEAECGKVATAREGQRHDTLLATARTLGGSIHHEYFTEAEVVENLTRAASGTGWDVARVAETIRDGIEYGKASPLPWPDKLTEPVATRDSQKAPASPAHASNRQALLREDDDDGLPINVRPWPEGPTGVAYHGLAGRIVRTIEPETEASPLALQVHLLVMVGNSVGRSPHIRVGAVRHYLNEFALIVGDSAVARKGTALAEIKEVLLHADENWTRNRVSSGLSSGEGLISAVRDPTYKREPIKEGKRIINYLDILDDPGVEDKRLLVVESEFGRTLASQGREGNILSAVMRQAWDGDSLQTMTKSALRATDTHISIIGHITNAELRERLSNVDAINGYANRFLFFAVQRSKNLPRGGRRVDVCALAAELADALAFARGVGEIELSPDAWTLWESHYPRLTTPPPGVLGSILSRAAPHTLRLAAIYALLDKSTCIMTEHLSAALAVWNASARCAAYIFGESLGDSVAETILDALKARPDGLTRTEIRSEVFKRNVPAPKIKAALARLMTSHLVREERDNGTGGAPAHRYHANAIDAINAKSPPHEDQGRWPASPYGVNGVNGVGATPESSRSTGGNERFEL
jgi:hypothetical protein